jgi:hypothetical protein
VLLLLLLRLKLLMLRLLLLLLLLLLRGLVPAIVLLGLLQLLHHGLHMGLAPRVHELLLGQRLLLQVHGAPAALVLWHRRSVLAAAGFQRVVLQTSTTLQRVITTRQR